MNELIEDRTGLKVYDYNRDPLRNKAGFSFLGKLPEVNSRNINASMFGIGFETLDRDTFNPEDMYDIAASTGTKHVRLQSGWIKCEKKRGVYSFSWLDTIVDNLLERGIRPWFSLSFGNPLYTPVPEFDKVIAAGGGTCDNGVVRGYVGEVPLYHGQAAIDGWLNYVRAIVAHFKGRATHWEIWNEPDHPHRFWCHSGIPHNANLPLMERLCRNAEDYARFVKITGAAVRSADPEAKVIGTTAAMYGSYIRTLGKMKIGEDIDVFSFHSYGPCPELGYYDKVNWIRNIIGIPGKNIEFWMGESGRPTDESKYPAYIPSEYNQAKYLSRRFAIDASGGLQHSSFFTISDFKAYYPDGTDQHYGLINARDNNRPKLAVEVFKSMTLLLAGAVSVPGITAVFTPEHDAKCCTYIPYHLITGTFRKNSIPVIFGYIPENIEFSLTPVSGELLLSLADADVEKLQRPIAVDPIRRNVYSIEHLTRTDYMHGLLTVNPISFFDYPLFITDASILEMV